MIAIFEDVLRDLIIHTGYFDRRVFLMRAPQKPHQEMTTPYVVMTPTGPQPEHAHSGPTLLQIRNYQISIFDPSQSMGLALADSLRLSIDGFKGVYGGVDFGAIFFRLQTSAYEADTRLYQIITEYRIHFRMAPSVVTTAVTSKGR